MIDFNYYSPTKIIFGLEKENEVGKIIKDYGYKKILFHYGKSSIKQNGLYDRIVNSLNENNIEFIELGNVEPNPKIDLVRKGVELAKKEKVEMILAVGGGSVIDSGKAIACGALVEFDPWLFNSHEKKPEFALPVGVILTISAAGSELSNSCVITNSLINVKNGFNSDLIRPLFSIMNPVLTYSVSKYQTACGIVDIMMHTLERYLVMDDSINLTDELALGLLKSVVRAGKKVNLNPFDYEARSTLMLASSFSHNGLTGMGTQMYFTVHRLEHIVSGNYDFVTHAAGLSILFFGWINFTKSLLMQKLYRFARTVMQVDNSLSFEETIDEGILELKKFFKEIGMPTSFSEIGLNKEQVIELAKKCKNIPSFIQLKEEDILEMFLYCL